MCVCACMRVCVCMRAPCAYVCARVCLTSLDVRAWLLVEASSGPGAGGGGGSRGRSGGLPSGEVFIQFGAACCHARCKHSSPTLASKGSLMLGWLTAFLLADLSLFFPFSLCHSHCHFQNSLQINRNYIDNFTGYPGITEAVVPANFRDTRTSFGLPPLGEPKILLLIPGPGRIVLHWFKSLILRF